MYHRIPAAVKLRMDQLEAIDRQDRSDGTPHQQRLRQVPAETGRLLALMASLAPPGPMLEIGTSAGYSSLWISLACLEAGRLLTSYEVLPQKVTIARDTIRQADVRAFVRIVQQDGLQALRETKRVAFLFLDADKDRSMDYYEIALTRLISGGLFLADNAISHRDKMGPMIDAAMAEPHLDALVVPVGKGVLVCRRAVE